MTTHAKWYKWSMQHGETVGIKCSVSGTTRVGLRTVQTSSEMTLEASISLVVGSGTAWTYRILGTRHCFLGSIDTPGPFNAATIGHWGAGTQTREFM
jgi:pantothenate kinase type III